MNEVTVKAYKAQPFVKSQGEFANLSIVFDEQIPDSDKLDTLAKCQVVYEGDARRIEKALFDILPGGTYDRLARLMLVRIGTDFKVPHVVPARTAVSPDPIVYHQYCKNCGDIRTGKDSLIVGDDVYCNDNCYEQVNGEPLLGGDPVCQAKVEAVRTGSYREGLAIGCVHQIVFGTLHPVSDWIALEGEDKERSRGIFSGIYEELDLAPIAYWGALDDDSKERLVACLIDVYKNLLLGLDALGEFSEACSIIVYTMNKSDISVRDYLDSVVKGHVADRLRAHFGTSVSWARLPILTETAVF